MKVCIKWVNKISKECGYVSKVCKKAGHFINADGDNKPMVYPNEGLASAAIKTLEEIGEARNNCFIIVDAPK